MKQFLKPESQEQRSEKALNDRLTALGTRIRKLETVQESIMTQIADLTKSVETFQDISTKLQKEFAEGYSDEEEDKDYTDDGFVVDDDVDSEDFDAMMDEDDDDVVAPPKKKVKIVEDDEEPVILEETETPNLPAEVQTAVDHFADNVVARNMSTKQAVQAKFKAPVRLPPKIVAPKAVVKHIK